jgi:hypothetical protein
MEASGTRVFSSRKKSFEADKIATSRVLKRESPPPHRAVGPGVQMPTDKDGTILGRDGCGWPLENPTSSNLHQYGASKGDGFACCEENKRAASQDMQQSAPAGLDRLNGVSVAEPQTVDWSRLAADLRLAYPIVSTTETAREGVSTADLIQDVIAKLFQRTLMGETVPQSHEELLSLAIHELETSRQSVGRRERRRNGLIEWIAPSVFLDEGGGAYGRVLFIQLAQYLYEYFKSDKDARRLVEVLFNPAVYETEFSDNRRLALLLEVTTDRVAKLKQRIQGVASSLIRTVDHTRTKAIP